jgi:hypothetical protein
MNPNDLASPSGDSFKFENVGDTIEGTIAYVGEPTDQTNKFTGNLEKVVRIGIDTGNGDVQYIWPRIGSMMAQAIAEACRKADVQLEMGHTLKVGYTANQDTGKPQPMKVFQARITPGVAAAVEEPF